MKDVIYAGFAQLSYLNWHNLSEELLRNILKGDRKLLSILQDIDAFNQIKTPDYNKMETDEHDYYVRKEEGIKIYDAKDSRSFYLYSENNKDPNNNPYYNEFGEWELKEQLVISS